MGGFSYDLALRLRKDPMAVRLCAPGAHRLRFAAGPQTTRWCDSCDYIDLYGVELWPRGRHDARVGMGWR